MTRVFRLVLTLTLMLAAVLVLGILATERRPGRRIDTAASMATAAFETSEMSALMQMHGAAMSADFAGTEDSRLAALGSRWLQDATTLAQRGQWLAAGATTISQVHEPVAALVADGSWPALTASEQAMRATDRGIIDRAALRTAGLAMIAEGDLLVSHAALMDEDILLMGEHQSGSGVRQLASSEGTARLLSARAAALRTAGLDLRRAGEGLLIELTTTERWLGSR